MDVPQVSLKLVFRGEELPRLDAVYFISGSETSVAEALQDRDLTKAVAVTLLLFCTYSTHGEMTLFRIRAAKPAGFIDTILNAKKQSQSKSPICGLANGAFLRLFLKSCTPTSRYIDINLSRLKPAAMEIILDGRTVTDAQVMKQMINLIAARKSWDLKDYLIEARPDSEDSRPAALDQQPLAVAQTRRQHSASPAVLDNPAFIAIREAVRNFCQDGVHEHLHVRQIQSSAELEDLWEIDNTAYGEASITYEKFKEWWMSFPSGLYALFFRTRVMGAIGIWPLSNRCAELFATGRLKESEINGRTMRTFLHAGAQFWYISGIVLRPELRGGRAITISFVPLHRVLACFSEYPFPLPAPRSCVLGTRPSLARRVRFLQAAERKDNAGRSAVICAQGQRSGAVTINTQVQGIGSMSTGGQSVELVNTKRLELFVPILKEIDFGDRFLLSMLHWCGIGHRSTPLDFWQVFLIRSAEQIVGVSGLYRQPGTPKHVCWLGWSAIRPLFRRQGFGSAAIYLLAEYAEIIGYKELWVYTDSTNEPAKNFYSKLGFELLGSARDYACGQTIDGSDIVLKLQLAASLDH